MSSSRQEQPDIDGIQRSLVDAINQRDLHEVTPILEANPQIGENIPSSSHIHVVTPAIQQNLPEILESLLKNKFRIGKFALFNAIQAESKECVAVILQYVDESQGDIGPGTILPETGFITPFMVAIHLEQYDIIDLLVQKGYRLIPWPDKEREDQEKFGEFALRSIQKIHYYRAQANPLYIAYEYLHDDSADHPLSQIFKISKDMLNLKKDVFEFESDYEDLSKKLDQFAVDLMESCRTVKDIQALTYIKVESESEKKDLEKEESKSEKKDLEKEESKSEKEDLEKEESESNKKDLEKEESESNKKDLEKGESESEKEGLENELIEGFLKFALRRRNVQLVAHLYSQLHLNEVLYRDIYTFLCCKTPWRDLCFLGKMGYSFLHTIMLPFLMIMYLIIYPCTLCYCRKLSRTREQTTGYWRTACEFCEKLESPVNKFLSHTGSFAMFVALLVLSSFQERFGFNIAEKPTAIDYFIFAWVIIMLIHEILKWHRQGLYRYYRGGWNVIPIIMVVVFFFSFMLRLIAYGLSKNNGIDPTQWYNIMLASNILYSFAMVLSCVHLSSAFQLSDVFGPLQLTLYKIFIDVFKFMVFFFMLFMAFAFSLMRLYSHYTHTQNHLHKQSKTSNEINKPDTEHPFSDFSVSFSNLLWAMFGMVDIERFGTNDEDHKVTKIAGHILLAVFLIVLMIVAINLLIAMMSQSYQTYADARDHWKMSRTLMWMNWADENTAPPPYSIFGDVIKIAYFLVKKLPCCNSNNNNEKAPNTVDKRRHTLRELIQRYLWMRRRKSCDNDVKTVTKDMLHELSSMQRQQIMRENASKEMRIPENSISNNKGIAPARRNSCPS